MWTRLSLRARISILLCVTFLCSALIGLVFLRAFASTQFRDEQETASATVAAMTLALNAALKEANDAPALLQAYVGALDAGGAGDIHFRSGADGATVPNQQASRHDTSALPDWFIRFIDPPQINESFPVIVGGKPVGAIIFAPAMDAELREKWVGFLMIALAAAVLTTLAITITYLTVGTALRPLRELDRGLGRLSAGDYAYAIPPAGPPDIAGSLNAANHLAATLRAYDKENRSLLRRMVSMQDDERRDLARELHDELGPLMFSIRANAIALADDDDTTSRLPEHPSNRLMASVEALQTINRRILDRLRPNDIDTLGLAKSIEALIDRTRREAPNLTLHASVDPAIEDLDPVVGGTIYRVVQEGLTNVLRHAQATTARVEIEDRGGAPCVRIADDGIGVSEELTAGRGLTGMRERTQAIGGKLAIAPCPGGGTLLEWSSQRSASDPARD